MTTVLVTGASGFVGNRLVRVLASDHRVIAISRSRVIGVQEQVVGSFASAADLARLDTYDIRVVVHLGAVMGGAPEDLALSVNVAGSRLLIRHLMDRGCRRFIVASSIAAAGCLSPSFEPETLPIADDHPCRAVDAYGLSKHLQEELAHYFVRATPDCDIVSLRIGSVMDSHGAPGDPAIVADPPKLPFLFFGKVRPDDVTDAFATIVNAPASPGSRVYNLVGPDSRTDAVVADVMRAAVGERGRHLDLAPFETIGRNAPPLWSMAALSRDYGFAPWRSVN